MSNPFVSKIIRHYLKYDRDNPFIFISGLLAFLGISTGVMVLMISMGIMNGTQQEFREKLSVMNYPLTLIPMDINATNDNLINKLQTKFPNLKFSPYYTTQVIIKSNGFVQGGVLYGVDSDREAYINPVFQKARGVLKSKFRIVVGDALSNELNAYESDKITIYFSEQDAIGFGIMPLQKRFIIDGIFDSGLESYDKAIMYSTLGAFEKILKRDRGVYDGIHIYSKEPLKDIIEIKKFLPSTVIIEGWWQQNGSFFSAMEMEKQALFLVLLLIIVVASLNIISSLLMTVMSRRSEIALLRTLGATKREIKQIFFRIGIIIGVGGIIFGTFLGSMGILALKTFDIISLPADVYGTTKLPVDLTITDFSLIIIGTSIIILLSSLYPAKKASETDPLVVLRSE
ncbi:Lipoprotein releasing system transmembrane protein LolC [hydrothermal vent metagenome]|uniref:Lipoprotein releasing system transmembrane protein LolC n=1 Tax=hydrothermal vent metagenome TaxID=652676 RepID=A0A1W1C2H8_9ZZZZ